AMKITFTPMRIVLWNGRKKYQICCPTMRGAYTLPYCLLTEEASRLSKKRNTMIKKNIIYTGLICLAMLSSAPAIFAQEKENNQSAEKITDLEPTLGKRDYDAQGRLIRYPRTYGGLTFTRIDWGFSRLMDDGSFTL